MITLSIMTVGMLFGLFLLLFLLFNQGRHILKQNRLQETMHSQITAWQKETLAWMRQHHETLEKHHHQQQSDLQNKLQIITDYLFKTLSHNTQQIQTITTAVNQNIDHGFSKTYKLFTSMVERLTIIDEAQKKMIQLASTVSNLENVLSDKQSRGIMGEVQLSHLIHNAFPKHCVGWQYTLSNESRVDCMLFLPQPTGNLAIDAKFPLEAYQRIMQKSASEIEKKQAKKAFRLSVKRHIQAIANKYILPGETAESAIMFIPAEAIFAEIHAYHLDLVDQAYKAKVWLTSPSTLMAILTTASAVIKDIATRKQVHIIQAHLRSLHDDFERFHKRMDQLSKHIGQVHNDVQQVHISSKKIKSRFQKIDDVDISSIDSTHEEEE